MRRSNLPWHGRLAHVLSIPWARRPCHVIALLLSLLCFNAQAEDRRWNLVSIVTDDQAQWAVGCYGNKEAITPNMDRLAREGAKFTNAFVVTPVCSPSRASFFTGKYGTELGITDWINGAETTVGLPADGVNWPKILQQNGYVT